MHLKLKSFLLGLLALPGIVFAQAAQLEFNMPKGVTPVSKDIYDLHMTIFWICVAIGIVVFSVMFYSLVRHRKSKGVQPAQFHGHAKVEIFWAVIPFLILVIMAIPATKVLMNMDDTSQAEVNIKITGYQWKWEYEYLDEGVRFFSNMSTPYDQIQNKQAKDRWYLLDVDNPVVVPINKKIRFLVTSNDVIHSWWVPTLGIKRDAIPGFVYEAWAHIDKPGIYRGQCAELCGINHAYMPIVVKAVTEQEYIAWVAKQKGSSANKAKTQTATPAPAPKNLTKAELMQKGEEIYNRNCAACHKADGSGMPPAFPAMKGSAIATGPVAAHINIVLNGKSGTPMQSFAEMLNDEEIAAVITYERNAFGNDNQQTYGKNAGGVVQPADIAKARQKS